MWYRGLSLLWLGRGRRKRCEARGSRLLSDSMDRDRGAMNAESDSTEGVTASTTYESVASTILRREYRQHPSLTQRDRPKQEQKKNKNA